MHPRQASGSTDRAPSATCTSTARTAQRRSPARTPCDQIESVRARRCWWCSQPGRRSDLARYVLRTGGRGAALGSDRRCCAAPSSSCRHDRATRWGRRSARRSRPTAAARSSSSPASASTTTACTQSVENQIVELLVRVIRRHPAARARRAPGETGEVVVTDLHNLAQPLIRYLTGDRGVARWRRRRVRAGARSTAFRPGPGPRGRDHARRSRRQGGRRPAVLASCSSSITERARSSSRSAQRADRHRRAAGGAAAGALARRGRAAGSRAYIVGKYLPGIPLQGHRGGRPTSRSQPPASAGWLWSSRRRDDPGLPGHRVPRRRQDHAHQRAAAAGGRRGRNRPGGSPSSSTSWVRSASTVTCCRPTPRARSSCRADACAAC
jgi:hypothetical protein